MPPGLSTTSYAVLGMLALRPWTAYELTRQMRRSLAYSWPKSESVLYDEPKRLVALGLATATEVPAGSRTRARYAITTEGRRELGRWLGTEPAPPHLEIEPMLRLLYADQGSREDLLAAVRSTRRWAEERWRAGVDQGREYLADGGPFPDRLHLIALFGDFYLGLFRGVVEWAERAEAEISSWPGTAGVGMTPGARRAIESLVASGPAPTGGRPAPPASG
jgi:PadR family transcriptional regulator AphA